MGLQEAYKSSLDRILIQPPGRASLALRVIGWVTHSEHPLTVNKILEAFAIEEDFDEIDEENLTSPKMLLQVCVGLVTINEVDSTLRMVHATVHEFIRSLPEGFAALEEDIAKICLGYQCLQPLEKGACTTSKTLTCAYKRCRFYHMLLSTRVLMSDESSNI
jgi:hypothetical protein